MRTTLAGHLPTRFPISRRTLGLGALGATLIGSGVAAQDTLRERKRQLPWTFAPMPVQGGTPGLSTMAAFHVFGGPGQEPSTIGNFKGSSGIAVINGNVTRTSIKTGEQRRCRSMMPTCGS